MTYEESKSRLDNLIDEGNRQMQKLNSRMSLSDLEKYLDDMSRRHEEMLSICRDRQRSVMSSINQTLNEWDNHQSTKTMVGKLDYSHYKGNDV